jgi:hypothetical protein
VKNIPGKVAGPQVYFRFNYVNRICILLCGFGAKSFCGPSHFDEVMEMIPGVQLC